MVIGKPVITSFTIEVDAQDQPPVLMDYAAKLPERHLVVDRIRVVLERFGPTRRWGAREVWLFGQVPGEEYADVMLWRQMTRIDMPPQPVEDSPSLPDWVREFVLERLQHTT